MSNFDFLTTEWKDIHEAATKAESAAIPDPRTSCFYARRALEPADPGEAWFLGVLVSGVRVPAFRVKERSICDHLAADFGVKRSRSRSCFPFLATSRRTCSLSQNFFNCDRRAA